MLGEGVAADDGWLDKAASVDGVGMLGEGVGAWLDEAAAVGARAADRIFSSEL